MSYVRGWHAWYGDGSEFSSTTHTLAQLPLIGFQLMMIYFRDGTRRVMSGNDRYFFYPNGSEDGIFASSDDPAIDILTRYPDATVIEGQLIDNAQYRVMEEAAHRRKEP